jgi:hypothetical protein
MEGISRIGKRKVGHVEIGVWGEEKEGCLGLGMVYVLIFKFVSVSLFVANLYHHLCEGAGVGLAADAKCANCVLGVRREFLLMCTKPLHIRNGSQSLFADAL